MRINKGVEWAAHACAVLAPLWPERGLSLAALAEFHDVPEPYMAKQMQALSRAGLVDGGRGRSGFYRLAKAPAEITLLDILLAVDGDEPMFRCTEIRQQGPCGSRPEDCIVPCNIAAGFARAEQAYRASLAQIDLVTLSRSVAAQIGMEKVMLAGQWIGERVRTRG
ncbi:Rrf2 family transcriptional regulator [Altererythrobacter sp. BO-6]|uniref:RrF2 family transcriptional regulator n=1 Tax=Altererythrobacter sp. BO-6 TaxID=2604537 RepID=UPI0013E1C111|nr:Rrf2 family transcriptional regulator [Altererythrobacter sp. BO-6]QIG54924.1 Rrf2 family transcriptional regulator [Altererythrobacter sp. BO-6]